MAEGADLTLPLAREQQALVYVFEGNVRLGNGDEKESGGRLVTDGQMAILAEGDAVRFRGVAGGGRLPAAGRVFRWASRSRATGPSS